jgi:hypothetical protein
MLGVLHSDMRAEHTQAGILPACPRKLLPAAWLTAVPAADSVGAAKVLAMRWSSAEMRSQSGSS